MSRKVGLLLMIAFLSGGLRSHEVQISGYGQAGNQYIYLPVQSKKYHVPQITFPAAAPQDLYIINADGTGLRRLIDDPGSLYEHAWSSEGDRIAVASDGYAGPNLDIYLTDHHGSGLSWLVTSPGWDYQLSWSPDSQRLAFNSDGVIYLVNTDGTGLSPLTTFPGNHSSPAWSPDGTRIAFMTENPPAGFQEDLFVINADGSGLVQLTQTLTFETLQGWSPDGEKVLFVEQGSNIYSVKADGTGKTFLAEGIEGMYSPNGSKIGFTSFRDGNPEIYIMDADGDNEERLTNEPEWDHYPTWSPDGKKIAFISERSLSSDIYMMNADGSGVIRITYNANVYSDIAWRP